VLVNFLLFLFPLVEQILLNLALYFLLLLVQVFKVQEERQRHLFWVLNCVSILDLVVVDQWEPFLCKLKFILRNSVLTVRYLRKNIISNICLHLLIFLSFLPRVRFVSFKDSSEVLFTAIDNDVKFEKLSLSVGEYFSDIVVPDVNFPFSLEHGQQKLVVWSKTHVHDVSFQSELFKQIIVDC
jgi:hypothetical protein